MSDAFGHLTRRTATRALNHQQSFATQITLLPCAAPTRCKHE